MEVRLISFPSMPAEDLCGMAVGAEVFETCVMIGVIERTADRLS